MTTTKESKCSNPKCEKEVSLDNQGHPRFAWAEFRYCSLDCTEQHFKDEVSRSVQGSEDSDQQP